MQEQMLSADGIGCSKGQVGVRTGNPSYREIVAIDDQHAGDKGQLAGREAGQQTQGFPDGIETIQKIKDKKKSQRKRTREGKTVRLVLNKAARCLA